MANKYMNMEYQWNEKLGKKCKTILPAHTPFRLPRIEPGLQP